ncbi:NAD(P)H-dependent oxidoreductase [Pseudoflavonifractor sp. DSM 107456]|uniref:NAD(P)H-dependent oxidoreductase n=1 Tax=Pseudoflavonifractor gallinarum TaxID=2779352 RepID=A0ABR9RD31_9FIRM|nr:flavodoxin [Pseudoflavonifractor gallinarum]MBE5056549.1 NAD(P)H-dependent oxidoreductase [Pseudoflavonifractor gallinarum]
MNALVAYFSATGTTAKAAKALANAVGGDLYEIKPAVPYTNADLNWMDKGSRSSVEMKDAHSRPALADTDAPVAGHDVIFLGFPVWWYVAPTILNTFLEAYDFTGKTIVLFATSGGSGLGKSAAGLRPSAPGAKIVDGKLLNGRLSEAELKAWVEGLKL